MKVKDLPPNMPLKFVKLRLPDEFKGVAGLNTQEVYLVSSWSNGIWVKTDRDETRMCPITGLNMSEILEWETV